jgi:molybdopterin synthase sulfur carrier subunit
MSVVRIPPVLRSEAGGAREVEAAGTTLREVIEDLSDQLPALGARIYGEDGLHTFVNVYVDGEDVRLRSGLETPVRSDTTVILLPAMAGGGG